MKYLSGWQLEKVHQRHRTYDEIDIRKNTQRIINGTKLIISNVIEYFNSHTVGNL